MFIISNYFVAVLCCILTMLCWGSWANTQKLSKTRTPQPYFYWDYVIGLVVLSLIAAFTLGSYGSEGRAFLLDLKQANLSSYILALASGTLFNLGNILLVLAIHVSGLAVAFPVAIGIALVLGVLTNYLALPIGDPHLLAAGTLCVLLAILIDAWAFRQLQRRLQTHLRAGLSLAIGAGILLGFFYRLMTNAMSPTLIIPAPGLLTPYSAFVLFAVGVCVSNLLFNTLWMRHNETEDQLTYRGYFTSTFHLHFLGILGGMIWAIGTLANFLATGIAGYAISYALGQGATLVAAIWGVYIWKEFKDATRGTHRMLYLMFALYLIGLSLIALAKLY